MIIKKTTCLLLTCLWLLAGESLAAEMQKMKVVILTGSNNHNWQETTPTLQNILERSGRFEVDLVTQPEKLTEATHANCDVLLSNWNNWGAKKGKQPAASWSEGLKRSYVEYVKNGGGHVMIHAGSSSFFDWEDYQKICCATWELGKTRHGPPHEFKVRPTAAEHPITRDMEELETLDELWVRPLVKPGATVLAEAYSDISKEWEPTAMASEFGKGRCFALLLGHASGHMKSPGFQTLLLRGTEWAATGQVNDAKEDSSHQREKATDRR
jgi:type 1 glutamine amidotransferase